MYQIQQLCGYLNFLGRSILLGRAFTRHLYSLIGVQNSGQTTKLKRHHHKKPNLTSNCGNISYIILQHIVIHLWTSAKLGKPMKYGSLQIHQKICHLVAEVGVRNSGSRNNGLQRKSPALILA